MNRMQSPNMNKQPFSAGGRYFAPLFWLVLLVIFIATGFYTVPADSEAVVQRYGKYLASEGPGLHFKIPFGVDEVTKVPIRRQLKLEFGFGSPQATNPYQVDSQRDQTKDMVTGDLNEAEVEWVVQYRISDAKQYLFAAQDPEDTLRAASEAVMREVIGDRTIDEVITFGRQDIETENLVRLQPLARQYNLGIMVDLVQLKNINPPAPVQASFNDVNSAQQEKQKAINQASGEYNKVIPRARGEASRVISEAEGYAQKRINEANGDANYFDSLLREYVKAPQVTRQRMYLETMSEIFPKLGPKVVIDEDLSKLLPLLPLQGISAAPGAR
jgi:membrane protease subunit HflK